MAGVRSIYRGATAKGYATPAGVPVYVDSDDNRLKMIPAGSWTAETIIQEASGAATQEVLTAARVLTAVDSGKVFFLALAGGFAVTLPAIAVGLNFKFLVQIAPTGDYTIVTPGAPAQIMCGLVHASNGADSDSETAFTATTVTFVAAAGASTIGDGCDIWCDGTSWYVRAYCNISTGITITG